jgi:glycosyltransferase involved in cell wall biosynthesis
LPASTPVALYAGNVDAYQDLPRWVDALGRLPDVHALFALAAAPPEWLHDAVARVRAAHRVTFTLANDADALGWVHAAADVAVVPRAVCAGVPVKALNSLAYGVPTVGLASALPDLPGLIRVDGDGADALAAAVRDALVGRTSALRGAAARAGSRNGPSWVDALARAVVGSDIGDAGSRDTR